MTLYLCFQIKREKTNIIKRILQFTQHSDFRLIPGDLLLHPICGRQVTGSGCVRGSVPCPQDFRDS
jgi:hypothetical protein